MSPLGLFDIFWGKLASRIRQRARLRKQGLLRKPSPGRRRQTFRLEPLEPRLLLSADFVYASDAGSLDATLKLADIGMQEADVERAAKIAAEAPYPNPRKVEYEPVLKLLRDAYEGRRPARPVFVE